METLTNVAATASKAIWGEPQANREPVSGVKGDTARGEPYDAGNLATPMQDQIEHRLEDKNVNGGSTNFNSMVTETSPQTSSNTQDMSDSPAARQSNKPVDTTAGQNDTRHPDKVSAEEPKDLEVDNKSTSLDSADDNLTGSGPRPVDQVARERGGDAGNDPSVAKAREEEKAKEESEESDENKGTSEEYVKSTGLKADGGDFDATNPGAGYEADRLMEEKGMHRDDEDNGDSNHHKAHTKDKPSLGERIKAKLHKH